MSDDNALTEPVGEHEYADGPASAPVTLVEYGDYECPHCGAAYPILKKVKERMGDNLRFVFRNFPLREMHPNAFGAAVAAEAAGRQGKFWQMHDMLYENQFDIAPEAFTAFAKELDLDMEQFAADTNDHALASKVRHDFKSGLMSGVNGTPSLFINGQRYDGYFTAHALLDALQEVV